MMRLREMAQSPVEEEEGEATRLLVKVSNAERHSVILFIRHQQEIKTMR